MVECQVHINSWRYRMKFTFTWIQVNVIINFQLCNDLQCLICTDSKILHRFT